MIFEELVVHDYGVYRGRQTFHLTPPGIGKPIVLVGGLNGAGKTSLLDALQLALYGTAAAVSGRRGLAYDKYLRRLINNSADPLEGAAVELAFGIYSQGSLQRYRVRRTWSTSDSGYTRESVEVFLNDRFDRALTERWPEQVEAFVPRGVAPLFFFDAEQIEAFASIETSRSLLRTSLQALLGLDLVDRLADDLAILQKRRYIRSADGAERALIAQLEREVASLRDTERKMSADLVAARGLVSDCEKAVDVASHRFRQGGGELFESRRALETSLNATKGRLDRIHGELRDLAEGTSCFLLVADILPALSEQARREHDVSKNEHLLGLLCDRDEEVLRLLRAGALSAESLATVEQVLSADRDRRQHIGASLPILGLDERSSESLLPLLNNLVQEQIGLLLPRLEEAQSAASERLQLERQLEGVPQEDAIALLQRERDESRHALERAKGALAAGEDRYVEALRALQEHERKLKKVVEETASQELHSEDGARLQKHTQRVMATLAGFQKQITARHLSRIEGAILSSLQQLLRKQRLVTALTIDLDSFTVQLTGDKGQRLTTEELSAGERQLLAIATLWGLARVSGRPLPVVIDTPLGRLDATHRNHLIKRYFPYASHQVILLSTDDEIDAVACQELRPFIGRKYQLVFEEEASATRVQEGYFC